MRSIKPAIKKSIFKFFNISSVLNINTKIEETANVKYKTFEPENVKIIEEGKFSLFEKENYEDNELTKEIFKVNDNIESVLFHNSGINIEIKDENEWENITPQLLEVIGEYYSENKDSLIVEDDIIKLDPFIIKVLDTYVRPYLQMDGGDITFIEYDEEEGIVYIQFEGACGTCGFRVMTMNNLVFDILNEFFNDVKKVEMI